jgi:hypothetical protein
MLESAVERETALPDLDALTLVLLAVEPPAAAPERDAIAVLPVPRPAIELPELRAALDAPPLLPPNECH